MAGEEMLFLLIVVLIDVWFYLGLKTAIKEVKEELEKEKELNKMFRQLYDLKYARYQREELL